MAQPIYLDHNATTPVLPEVVEAMCACWAKPFLNPSSQHEFGRQARRTLEDARERVAELLGAAADDRIIFTSGGTEANNLAIRGLVARVCSNDVHRPRPGTTAHIVISAAEHPSITSVAKELQRCGHDIDFLPLSINGTIQIGGLDEIRRDTTLVAATLGNNETGVLQPVAELAAICCKHGIPLHTDAAQVAGKMPINFRSLGAATMTIAAHKFGGPIGIGALAIRDQINLQPQLFGGFQQSGIRPGTESVALAVGMSLALELWNDRRDQLVQELQALRARFEKAVLSGYARAVIIGSNARRLPHVSNIAFVGLDRQQLFLALDQAGVACSTGSACASGSSEPSPVHIAMGCTGDVISSVLRFSLGTTTTGAEIDDASRRILKICNSLRRKK